MRLLDLFCGRWGWSRAFAARGWHCVGVDLAAPSEIPQNCEWWQADVFEMTVHNKWFRIHDIGFNKTVACYDFDFIVASSPCEQFSVHGMKHFHPNPPYPELGIKLFNHTRALCEASGVPWVMENVRAAQQFVGNAVHHCGPFYLWGTGVPPILPQGILKGVNTGGSVSNKGLSREEIKKYRQQFDPMWSNSKSEKRKQATAQAATIPPELAACVAEYAERILEKVPRMTLPSTREAIGYEKGNG